MRKLPGDKEAKRRVELIHLTMAEKLSVEDACAELGISPSRFDQLRTQMLLACIAEFTPRPVGRPRRGAVISERELELRQQNADLEQENRILKAQVEVAGLRRNHAATRSKSVGKTASRPTSPRSDAAGGAVPRSAGEGSSRP